MLVALKEKIPPDTAWYAPAAALPSTACLLIYSGFDLFDYRGGSTSRLRRRSSASPPKASSPLH